MQWIYFFCNCGVILNFVATEVIIQFLQEGACIIRVELVCARILETVERLNCITGSVG
jgi:hypothetical protein